MDEFSSNFIHPSCFHMTWETPPEYCFGWVILRSTAWHLWILKHVVQKLLNPNPTPVQVPKLWFDFPAVVGDNRHLVTHEPVGFGVMTGGSSRLWEIYRSFQRHLWNVPQFDEGRPGDVDPSPKSIFYSRNSSKMICNFHTCKLINLTHHAFT